MDWLTFALGTAFGGASGFLLGCEIGAETGSEFCKSVIYGYRHPIETLRTILKGHHP